MGTIDDDDDDDDVRRREMRSMPRMPTGRAIARPSADMLPAMGADVASDSSSARDDVRGLVIGGSVSCVCAGGEKYVGTTLPACLSTLYVLVRQYFTIHDTMVLEILL